MSSPRSSRTSTRPEKCSLPARNRNDQRGRLVSHFTSLLDQATRVNREGVYRKPFWHQQAPLQS